MACGQHALPAPRFEKQRRERKLWQKEKPTKVMKSNNNLETRIYSGLRPINLYFVAIVLLFATISSKAQNMAGKTVLIPAGTTFEGRIDSTIGSKVSRQGEKFTVTISSPLLANGSEVLIPAGSQVLGEVVEAIPSGKVPHAKKTPKPMGKLRTQLTSMRLPDGAVYPLIASVVPDKTSAKLGRGGGMNQGRLGTGVAYVGSQGNFDAVSPNNPGSSPRGAKKGIKVVTGDQLMKDPLLGLGKQANFGGEIRSLVKKKNDYYIYSGSPLSMRIDAPFKVGIGQTPGATANYDVPPESQAVPSGHKRFSHASQEQAPAEGDQQAGPGEGNQQTPGGDQMQQQSPQANTAPQKPKKDPGDADF